jgi:hypothetical protein
MLAQAAHVRLALNRRSQKLAALQGPPVEVLNRHAFRIKSFEAANIDRGHLIAFGIGAFSIWMNATRLAKAMLDYLLVERIRADVLFRCEHAQLIARHKPQKRSFARTHGAIA